MTIPSPNLVGHHIGWRSNCSPFALGALFIPEKISTESSTQNHLNKKNLWTSIRVIMQKLLLNSECSGIGNACGAHLSSLFPRSRILLGGHRSSYNSSFSWTCNREISTRMSIAVEKFWQVKLASEWWSPVIWLWVKRGTLLRQLDVSFTTRISHIPCTWNRSNSTSLSSGS